MSFAAALSEHPLAAHAVGEVVGQVLESVGEAPDLAVLFVTAPHTGVLEDIAGTVRTLLRPGVLIGCTAVSVVGNGREVEEDAAISLWAGRTGPVTSLRLRVQRTAEGAAIAGWPADLAADASGVLLLADPFSFPTEQLLTALPDQTGTTLPIIGGLASAGRGPGGNRLVLDGALMTDGAVGVVLGPEVDVTAVVSQGCRPIGEPYTVTKAEGQVIYELAGRPALERVQEIVRALSPGDQVLAGQGIHLGRVIDEHRAEFGRGDFLIRNLVGADREAGAIAVGDLVEVGSTVQLQVRDAASADEDLHELLSGRRADSALVFTCNGRGSHLFGRPHHDAEAVADHLDAAPAAGMFCAGEIGPIGGRSFLHGFTASIALLRRARRPGGREGPG